jgi:hypothetical protein
VLALAEWSVAMFGNSGDYSINNSDSIIELKLRIHCDTCIALKIHERGPQFRPEEETEEEKEKEDQELCSVASYK